MLNDNIIYQEYYKKKGGGIKFLFIRLSDDRNLMIVSLKNFSDKKNPHHA